MRGPLTWPETSQPLLGQKPSPGGLPPVLPSVKWSPFTDGRTGGRPPGDGFCPSSGWLVSGQVQGPRMRRQSPQHRPPSGPRAPPLRYQAGFTRSLGSVPGPGSPPCTAQDGAFSRGPSFSAVLPPRGGRVPREDLGTWGRGGGRPRFHARWRWTGRAGRRPLDEFSLGTQACSLLRG